MYVTYKVKEKNPFDFNSLFDAMLNNEEVPEIKAGPLTFKTICLSEAQIQEAQLPKAYNTYDMFTQLFKQAEKFKKNIKKPIEEYYKTFQIPKASGGFRTISAPEEALNQLLKETLYMFEYRLHALPSEATFAFTHHRNTKLALVKHQENQSRWFLKLDIKDFFPSCNEDFIIEQLNQLFPFGDINKYDNDNETLRTIIQYCLLNGSLPQGSPMSPLLTNLIMIPFDYKLLNKLPKEMVYTRYADDIIISSPYNFNWKKIADMVKSILEPQFKIKDSKTRYGSCAGRNWNLGLMYNKDLNITVGWRNKKHLKSQLVHLVYHHQEMTELEIQQLQGIIAYYKAIEPEYFNYIIEKYSEHFETDINTLLKP